MKKTVILFMALIAVTALSGCTQSLTQNRVDKLNSIISPDETMEVYLKKEYDSNVERFIKQSVVLENLQTGNKVVLNEIKVTPEEAQIRYTEDGCNADKTVCCNSVINFNEFEPVKWIDEETVQVNKYLDNYECAGTVTYTSIYNINGEEIDTWMLNANGEKVDKK